LSDNISKFPGVDCAEPNVTKTVLIVSGSEDDVRLLIKGYYLDQKRVVHIEDYEEALREKYLRHHRGERVGLVTVGHSSRDLVRLTLPPREYEAEIIQPDDLRNDLERMWERAIPIQRDAVALDALTWDELVRRESRLHDLLVLTETVDRDVWPQYYSNAAIYNPRVPDRSTGIKYQLTRLVGDYAITDDGVIRTSEAYELAMHTLYEALPYDFTEAELAARREESQGPTDIDDVPF
jgi:hypothetical protein